MKIKTLNWIGIFLIGFLMIGEVGAAVVASGGVAFTNPQQTSLSTYQYSEPSFNSYYSASDIATYWPRMSDIYNEQCEATSDFIVMIRPGGCSPAVVRSDLLAEQNVPVFCQLDAIKLNPLIKVSSIKSITFKGSGNSSGYPEGVAGISFHPARAAISTYKTLLGSPILNNIGYVVIVLKKQPNENLQPEEIFGNLTATIYYDADEAYGTGKAEFYAPIITDSEWNSQYAGYGFWNGKGFLRVEDVNDDVAKISLYTDKDHIFRSFNLKEGETSGKIYFPGFYCKAGLRVKLNDVVANDEQVLLNVDGQPIWIRKGGKFLNDQCTVRDIVTNPDRTGSVSVYCSGNKNFELSFKKSPMEFEVTKGGNKELKRYYLGDKIPGNKKDFYVSYIGLLPEGIQEQNKDLKGQDFVVLAESSSGLTEKNLAKLSNNINGFDKKNKVWTLEEFNKIIVQGISQVGQTQEGFSSIILVKGDNQKDGDFGFEFKGIATQDKDYDFETQDIGTYFNKAKEAVAGEKNSLTGLYPHEGSEISVFGEEALWEFIVLADNLKQFKTETEYLGKFLELYPSSKKIGEVNNRLSKLAYFDMKLSSAVVFVSNENHFISVSDFQPLDLSKKNVDIAINGKSFNYNEEDIFLAATGEKAEIRTEDNVKKIYVGGVDKTIYGDKTGEKPTLPDYFVVNKINIDDVQLTYYYSEEIDGKTSSGKTMSKTMKELDSESFEPGVKIQIKKINIDRFAYISLIPEVDNTKTEADFSFRLGVEKRAIDLSPEQIKDRLAELNDTISDWESLNEKFGNLLKGFKGACFATAGVLTIKNLISGFGGGSIARPEVMKTWRAKCDAWIATGTKGYKTRTECYNAEESNINKDVAAYADAVTKINQNIKDTKVVTKEASLFGDEVRNSKDSLEKYRNQLSGLSFTTSDGKTYSASNAQTVNQLKALELWTEVNKNPSVSAELKTSAKNAMISEWTPVFEKGREDEAKGKAADAFGALGINVDKEDIQSATSSKFEWRVWGGKTLGDYTALADLDSSLSGDTKIQMFTYNNQKYVLILKESGTGTLGVSEAYRVSGNSLVKVGNQDKGPDQESITLKELQGYGFYTGGKCSNKFIGPKVKYYQTGTDSGMPAIVPFDLEAGWYAKVNSAGSGLLSEAQKGYLASGDVSTFYVCNVGGDGRQETSDDNCQSFNVNSYKDVKDFSGCSLSSSEIQRLAEKARDAIKQAARQYGQSTVTIGNNRMDAGVTSASEGLYECQDFMSPGECKLLFNVCDPVICPSSRCDFGGKIKVANVVQSGIIGSIALCLPNFREGIMLPVCLTGINAGIDNWISILKARRDCLQHSLDTGEQIGICDEISAIYTCEFFWNQLSPLINMIIPKIVSSAYGQPATTGRGGGEYLTVMQSWQNAEKAVDYFKNVYAQNAFKAFQLRNSQEIGSMFCKSFVGTSVPGGGDFLDNLLAPESPVQFYAQFSESLFSDATVPPTSHYKVYYHIYAGNDKGAQFRVYLKNPPATGYYSQNPIVIVKTGYITKGEMVDEAIDMTAPSGYKELCVQIDAQEWCGFKSVSTDFALEYIRDKYVAEQANQTVTTEKECISGSPSLWGLADLNIQSGVESAINPDISLRGVVRVCATENPGMGSLGNVSRWVPVGNCGNENLKCWLDKKSVEDELRKIDAVEETDSFESLQKAADASIGKTGGVLSEEDSQSALAILRKDIEGVLQKIKKESNENTIEEFMYLGEPWNSEKSIIKRLNGLADVDVLGEGKVGERGFSNAERAEALLLKFRLYEKIVRILDGGEVPDVIAVQAGVDAEQQVVEVGVAEGGKISGSISQIYFETEDGNKINSITTISQKKVNLSIENSGCDKIEYTLVKSEPGIFTADSKQVGAVFEDIEDNPKLSVDLGFLRNEGKYYAFALCYDKDGENYIYRERKQTEILNIEFVSEPAPQPVPGEADGPPQ